jgi:hypothetical protein
MNSRPRTDSGVSPEWLAWLAALLPVLVIHGLYLYSAHAGHVPWCLPYLDGCTSISAAARQGHAVYGFRAVMLPYAVVLAAYWWVAALWCRALLPQARIRRGCVLGLGLVGAAFYLLYATFLGEQGPVYQLLRRYGINLYFAFTVLAQMLLISLLARQPRIPAALRRMFLLLFALLILLGLASLPLQYLVEDRDALLNAIEWSYALLMVCLYPLTGRAWRATGLRLQIRLQPAG